MATPVSRSFISNGNASLQFLRSSILGRANLNPVRDPKLLAPTSILGQSPLQKPVDSESSQRSSAFLPHLLCQQLFFGENGGSVLERDHWRLAAEADMEMRGRVKKYDEDEDEDEDEAEFEDEYGDCSDPDEDFRGSRGYDVDEDEDFEEMEKEKIKNKNKKGDDDDEYYDSDA